MDVLERFPPPLELTADMLFAAATAPLGPLRRSFPEVPFRSLLGRVPLLLWFSRVHGLTFRRGRERVQLGPAEGFEYQELNVVVPCSGPSLFIPVIYASAGISLELGHRYGMPKRATEMTFTASDAKVVSRALIAGRTSVAEASLLASGRLFALAARRLLPLETWPAAFPQGPDIRATVTAVPRAQLAAVSGSLDLPVPWLEEARDLWRLGVRVPGFRMVLPAPGESRPAAWSR